MDLDFDISWRRGAVGSVRTLCSADFRALRALVESAGWRNAAGRSAKDARESVRRRPSRTSLSYALEVDQQLAGAAILTAGDLDADLGRYPWSRLEETLRVERRQSPPWETLFVESLGWIERRASPEHVGAWIRGSLVESCRRHGIGRVVVPVRLERVSPAAPHEFGPETVLQQLHFRGLESPALQPLFERDFELRGYGRRVPGDATRWVAMVWENDSQ